MFIHIPSPLRSYTKNESKVEIDGATVGELLEKMDHFYPGFRFRIIDEQDNIRKHIRIYTDKNLVSQLDTPLESVEAVHIICALSGG